jgi:hypothetical protein
MDDQPTFTVDIQPTVRREPTDVPGEVSERVTYDIHVTDLNGNLLLFSKQGYENRQDAEWIAIRLFGSSLVIAEHLGIDPPENRTAEHAVLNVWGADGALDKRLELR